MLGQKFVVRENTAMRYFFFSLSFGKSQLFQARSSRVARLCSTSTLLPLPNPSALRFIFALPHAQVPLLDKRPLGSSRMGWGPLFKVDATTRPHTAKDLFCLSFCFQPALEQRSQDQLTNRYKAKRQRDSDSEASHQKRWRQGRSMPLMARPLNGWSQVFSHSLTLG